MLRWIPAAIMMIAIFVLSATPASNLPYFGEFDLVVKKGGHAVGYAMLGLSYFYALPQRLTRTYRFIMAWFMAILFALSDEYHQSFVIGRNSSLIDVAIDGVGAFLALSVGTIYSSNSSSNSSS
jgi:VanZ family protein